MRIVPRKESWYIHVDNIIATRKSTTINSYFQLFAETLQILNRTFFQQKSIIFSVHFLCLHNGGDPKSRPPTSDTRVVFIMRWS